MRLIDADRLKRQVEGRSWRAKDKMVELIDNSPTIEAEPIKHGKWINDNHQRRCSICGRPIPLRKVRHNGEVIWEDNSPVNYCPRCGAKMEPEGEEKE